MTALLVLAGIVFLVALLLQLRLGVLLGYQGTAPLVKLRIGPFWMTLWPRKKDPEKARKKQEKKAAKAKKKERKKKPKPEKQKHEKDATITLVLELFKIATEAAGKFRRKLRIDQLILEMTWGAPDPADAAIRYGDTWAGIGVLMPVVEETFLVKEKRISVQLDYAQQSPQINAQILISLRLWELLGLGFCAGIQGLKAYRTYRKSAPEQATGNLKKGGVHNGTESSHQ